VEWTQADPHRPHSALDYLSPCDFELKTFSSSPFFFGTREKKKTTEEKKPALWGTVSESTQLSTERG
jgi:hypothetical protein